MWNATLDAPCVGADICRNDSSKIAACKRGFTGPAVRAAATRLPPDCWCAALKSPDTKRVSEESPFVNMCGGGNCPSDTLSGGSERGVRTCCSEAPSLCRGGYPERAAGLAGKADADEVPGLSGTPYNLSSSRRSSAQRRCISRRAATTRSAQREAQKDAVFCTPSCMRAVTSSRTPSMSRLTSSARSSAVRRGVVAMRGFAAMLGGAAAMTSAMAGHFCDEGRDF